MRYQATTKQVCKMNRQKSDEPKKTAVRLHTDASAVKTGHSIHTIRGYELQDLLPRVYTTQAVNASTANAT